VTTARGVATLEADGTNGGAAGAETGGAAGAEKGGAPAGLKGGSGGGGENSGTSDDGDGGVAVAAAVVRSIDSGLGRWAAGVSAVRSGGGGALERCGTGADGVRAADEPKGVESQPPWVAGVEYGRACESGELGVGWLPDGAVF
jgi:hypothetical protein